MEFSPANPIVILCLQGMVMEDQNKTEEALKLFLQAWNEASNDLEKFLGAYYVARCQNNISDKIKWLETALQFALRINDPATNASLPSLYLQIGKYYDDLGDFVTSGKNYASANSLSNKPSDAGPFYHGTKADLKVGDELIPGKLSNYQLDLKMNHIYFTASPNGAGLAAALAKGQGKERVYIVEPSGNFESDPNVTNKKFPGNPTRSYRTTASLKIVGELNEWVRLPDEELQKFRKKLDNNTGEIIN